MATKKKQSDIADKFMLRMPDGLRARIAVTAADNNRSMNAEIVSTLERAYPEIPDFEEFQNDISYLLDTYKKNTGRDWSRKDMRQLLATVVFQIAHGKPDANE